jgi:hypothetical protein
MPSIPNHVFKKAELSYCGRDDSTPNPQCEGSEVHFDIGDPKDFLAGN